MSDRKIRILIVSDNRTNGELLRECVDDPHYEILVDDIVGDTLERVAAAAPTLLLLDVTAPAPSGLDVCTSLKRNPSTRAILIMLVTAVNHVGEIERAVSAAIDDFLVKPVHELELVKRIENLLGPLVT